MRADCLPGGHNEVRPCPHVSCWWHMLSERGHGGTRQQDGADRRSPWYMGLSADRLPRVDPTTLDASCILDASEAAPGSGRGDGMTLDAVGSAMGRTRERMRQIEARACRKARSMGAAKAALDIVRMLDSGDLDGIAPMARRTDIWPCGGPLITSEDRRRTAAAVARLGTAGRPRCGRPGCHRPPMRSAMRRPEGSLAYCSCRCRTADAARAGR